MRERRREPRRFSDWEALLFWAILPAVLALFFFI